MWIWHPMFWHVQYLHLHYLARSVSFLFYSLLLFYCTSLSHFSIPSIWCLFSRNHVNMYATTRCHSLYICHWDPGHWLHIVGLDCQGSRASLRIPTVDSWERLLGSTGWRQRQNGYSRPWELMLGAVHSGLEQLQIHCLTNLLAPSPHSVRQGLGLTAFRA